ncbi:endolytic transglycosylase MltG [Alistipes indistinctus]|jgi:hypothetical protein|uniref:endolytic transglycosylase MltG n=1 Tax=Alistipes indistinctus TaxID=626932 RepID=UPI003AAD7569
MKKRLNRKGWVLLGSLILIVTVLGAAGLSLGRYYWATAVERSGVVYVPTGASFTQLMDSLRRHEVLRNETAFARMACRHGLDTPLKAGRYELKEGMSYVRTVRMLRLGWQVPVRVTFNNIRTPDRLAGVLARKLEPDSAAWLAALTSDSLARVYGLTPQTILTLCIPNTYEFFWNTSPDTFLQRMRQESDKFWTSRDAKLSRSGLTRQQAYILASIVYEETKRKNEMPRVAGVYVNRLKRGMPLQADPTVKYAVGDFALRRVLNRHLEVDSPYNTYKYPGLPPGPICMPSIDALDGVVDFENHDYLYFCAKDDLSGAHAFARTLAEHNRNAQAYARALNRRGIR